MLLLSLSQAALNSAATAPPSTPPLDALLASLTSTCPSAVSPSDAGPTLNLSPLGRSVFDAALRVVLARLAGDAADAGEPLMEHAPAGSGEAAALPRLLDLVVGLGGSGAVDQGKGAWERGEGGGGAAPSRPPSSTSTSPLTPSLSLPATALAAIEDAVDLAPSSADAGAVFAWVEAAHGGGRLGPPAYAADRAKLALLRTSNALLRRASRVAAPGLRGRALLFLARACPLADKSGLNLLGGLNAAHPLAVPPVPPGAADTGGRPIDGPLYDSFWGLQASFQDPYSLVRSPGAWAAFAGGVRAVLAAYLATPFAVGAPAAGAAGGAAAPGGPPPVPGAAAPAVPPPSATLAPDPGVVEYLAAPPLFPLQMADPGARAPVLIQALITLHALRHLPPRVAAAVPGGGLGGPAAGEAAALEAALLAELARTPPGGKALAAGVAAALAGEGAWSAWKHARVPPCPPFERGVAGPPPPPAGGGVADPRTGAAAVGDAASPRPTKRARPAPSPPAAGRGLGAPGPPSLGTADLDRLWSLTPGGPASCLTVADRGHAPSLRDFLGRVALEMDPEAGVEAAARGSADPVYLWKALRLLSRADLATFSAVLAARSEGGGGGGLEVALRGLYPGDVPAGALKAGEGAAAAARRAAAAAVEAAEEAEAAGAEAEAGAAPPDAGAGAAEVVVGEGGAGSAEPADAADAEEGEAQPDVGEEAEAEVDAAKDGAEEDEAGEAVAMAD